MTGSRLKHKQSHGHGTNLAFTPNFRHFTFTPSTHLPWKHSSACY